MSYIPLVSKQVVNLLPIFQMLNNMQNKNTFIHNNEYICRICGLIQDEPTWEEEVSSHNLCPCCGVEFGYEDITLISIRQYRTKWIDLGYKWVEPNLMPQNWDIDKQLKNIPTLYL